KAQRNIGSVAFGDKDREYCSLAAKAFSSWARLRAPWNGASTARQIAGDVACVLSFLKIPIASAADVKIEQDTAWISVTLSGSISASPLPVFGSAINGKLTVAVARVKQPARQLADSLRQKNAQR